MITRIVAQNAEAVVGLNVHPGSRVTAAKKIMR